MSARLHLTWADFDAAVASLARQMPEGATALYGIPRGGLPLAVALSHATGLPLAPSPAREGVVLVDEIADSGRTLSQMRLVWGERPALVWVRRQGCSGPVIYAREVRGDAWIVFPWERPEKAEADEEAYAASKSSVGGLTSAA